MNNIEPWVIPEMNIKLGEGVDTAFACDIPVLVEFSYEPGIEGRYSGPPEDCWPSEPAMATVHSVKIAGDSVTLEGERTSLIFHDGCDITPYLDTSDIDRIEEEMCKRIDESAEDSRADYEIDRYEDSRLN